MRNQPWVTYDQWRVSSERDQPWVTYDQWRVSERDQPWVIYIYCKFSVKSNTLFCFQLVEDGRFRKPSYKLLIGIIVVSNAIFWLVKTYSDNRFYLYAGPIISFLSYRGEKGMGCGIPLSYNLFSSLESTHMLLLCLQNYKQHKGETRDIKAYFFVGEETNIFSSPLSVSPDSNIIDAYRVTVYNCVLFLITIT